MDYKRVLILHFTNGMSGRGIAETTGDKKTTVNEFLKRFRECEELSYARIQILFIDDFAISRYSEDGIKILYHLIKTRTDLKTSTMFTSQYAPSEWGKYLSDEENCYGKLDGIRRRLTTGYTVHIEKL